MKIILPRFANTFTFSRLMLILTIFGVTLFVSLGFWQMRRGEEKRQMLVSFADKERMPAIFWQQKDFEPPSQYQKLRVQGHFLSKIFLLDNQYRNHKFGYDVIQALLLENGRIVLVDRGWIASSNRGKGLLYLENYISSNVTEITGMAYFPSKKGFVLGTPFEEISKNIVIIETQDPILISKLLHKSVYPFIIRESENPSGPFLQQWPVVSMPPERHYAYALQWFGLALVTIIIFISLKKRHA